MQQSQPQPNQYPPQQHSIPQQPQGPPRYYAPPPHYGYPQMPPPQHKMQYPPHIRLPSPNGIYPQGMPQQQQQQRLSPVMYHQQQRMPFPPHGQQMPMMGNKPPPGYPGYPMPQQMAPGQCPPQMQHPGQMPQHPGHQQMPQQQMMPPQMQPMYPQYPQQYQQYPMNPQARNQYPSPPPKSPFGDPVFMPHQQYQGNLVKKRSSANEEDLDDEDISEYNTMQTQFEEKKQMLEVISEESKLEEAQKQLKSASSSGKSNGAVSESNSAQRQPEAQHGAKSMMHIPNILNNPMDLYRVGSQMLPPNNAFHFGGEAAKPLVCQKMENYNQLHGHSSNKKGQTFQQMSLKKGQAKNQFSDFKIQPLTFNDEPQQIPQQAIQIEKDRDIITWNQRQEQIDQALAELEKNKQRQLERFNQQEQQEQQQLLKGESSSQKPEEVIQEEEKVPSPQQIQNTFPEEQISQADPVVSIRSEQLNPNPDQQLSSLFQSQLYSYLEKNIKKQIPRSSKKSQKKVIEALFTDYEKQLHQQIRQKVEMYEKKKKLDVESEDPEPSIHSHVEPPKNENDKKKEEFNLLQQFQQSILSNQPKQESSRDQELTNRLNLINQSLKKLDIKDLQNKDQLFNSLNQLDGHISQIVSQFSQQQQAPPQLPQGTFQLGQKQVNEIIQRTIRDINFLPFSQVIEIVYIFILSKNVSVLPMIQQQIQNVYKENNSSRSRSSSGHDVYRNDSFGPDEKKEKRSSSQCSQKSKTNQKLPNCLNPFFYRLGNNQKLQNNFFDLINQEIDNQLKKSHSSSQQIFRIDSMNNVSINNNIFKLASSFSQSFISNMNMRPQKRHYSNGPSNNISESNNNSFCGDFGPNIQRQTSFSKLNSLFSRHNQDKIDNPKQFLTLEAILGEGMFAYWTNFDYYEKQGLHQNLPELQKRFARVTKVKNSLVIEPVGLFLHLLNPFKDALSLRDQLCPQVKQIEYTHEDQNYIALLKIWTQGLIKQLKKLAKNYEIIIYTILPTDVMDKIYKLDPEFADIISHTLCFEQLVFQDGYPCKDLALLAENRTQNLEAQDDEEQAVCSEIIVIDVLDSKESSDPHCVTYFQGQPYDGQLHYANIDYINTILKGYRQDKMTGVVNEIQGMQNEQVEQSQQL